MSNVVFVLCPRTLIKINIILLMKWKQYSTLLTLLVTLIARLADCLRELSEIWFLLDSEFSCHHGTDDIMVHHGTVRHGRAKSNKVYAQCQKRTELVDNALPPTAPKLLKHDGCLSIFMEWNVDVFIVEIMILLYILFWGTF